MPAAIGMECGLTDLEHTPDFATVTWRGREFTFTGYQRAVVKLLVEHRGKALSQSLILEQIGSSSDRLRDLFKSRKGMHEAWTTFIHTPPQHNLGRDLFLVPREVPAEPPGGPQAISDPSVSGSSIDAPANEGEQDMVSRLPADSNDLDAWLDGEIPALCSDLIADRNFTRVLLRWGAMRHRTTKDQIRAASCRFEAENLVAGLHHAVEMGSRSQSLTWLDTQLNALADAWAPEESKRLAARCRGAFTPNGVVTDGAGLVDASMYLKVWLDTGDVDYLYGSTEYLAYAPSSPNPSEEQLVRDVLRALRATEPLSGGRIAAKLADALENREASRIELDFDELQDDILDQVWAR